jgi:hypothetical protein
MTHIFVIYGYSSLQVSRTKNPGPNWVITAKGSFKLSDRCDKEFHKLAQTFGMIAEYA